MEQITFFFIIVKNMALNQQVKKIIFFRVVIFYPMSHISYFFCQKNPKCISSEKKLKIQ